MSQAEDPLVAVLRRLEERAQAAQDNPPPRPEAAEEWRPSGLLIALGDQVDDLELLDERDAWPGRPE